MLLLKEVDITASIAFLSGAPSKRLLMRFDTTTIKITITAVQWCRYDGACYS